MTGDLLRRDWDTDTYKRKTPRRHREKRAICQPRREASGGNQPSSHPDLRLPVSRAMRPVWFGQLSLCYSVLAAFANEYRSHRKPTHGLQRLHLKGPKGTWVEGHHQKGGACW